MAVTLMRIASIIFLLATVVVSGLTLYQRHQKRVNEGCDVYTPLRRDLLKIADQSKPERAIVFIGDSLTESLATGNIPNSVNYGIACNTTGDVNRRIHDYDFSDVRVLVLMIGTNNLVLDVPVERLDLPDVPILWYAAPSPDGIEELNDGFERECSAHPRCKFIRLDFGDNFTDGVHLNKAGNDIWLRSLERELR